MMLLIDIGNTRLKWGLHDGTKIITSGSGSYADPGELPVAIDASGVSPECAYLASVGAHDVASRVCQEIESHYGIRVEVMQTGTKCCGVVNGYLQPGRLGIDRWAAMVGAKLRFSGPLCVVDSGSAVTIDALNSEGRHLGGYIVPGLEMQRSLLQKGTATVRVTEPVMESTAWGRDTAACLTQGGIEAIVGLVERAARRLEEQCSEAVTTVITGGDAEVILPLLELDAHKEEFLVFEGMARMVRESEE